MHDLDLTSRLVTAAATAAERLRLSPTADELRFAADCVLDDGLPVETLAPADLDVVMGGAVCVAMGL